MRQQNRLGSCRARLNAFAQAADAPPLPLAVDVNHIGLDLAGILHLGNVPNVDGRSLTRSNAGSTRWNTSRPTREDQRTVQADPPAGDRARARVQRKQEPAVLA